MSKEVSLVPSKDEFEIIQTIAKCAVDSKYFEKMGGTAGIIMIALYAKEIGIPIATALMGGLQNVMGKITMSPELMNSLIRQNGHKIEIIESNANICRIKGIRKDTGESYVASFSLEDAKKAGIFKSGGGWDKYPEDMCFARAISRLRRRLFPDVASRSYATGEIEDDHRSSAPSNETIDVVEGIKQIPSLYSDVATLEMRTDKIDLPKKEKATTYPLETGLITVKGPTISISEEIKIIEAIGDDKEYSDRILAHYKASHFIDIEHKHFDLIMSKAQEHRAQRVKKEMETV